MSAHVRPPGVGEQRSVAQRARPELHAALEPGDDLAACDHARGIAAGDLLRRALRPADFHRSQRCRWPLEFRPEIGRRIAAPRAGASAFGAMHRKGGADRGAGVVRRRRDEHIAEFTAAPDQLVGHTIQGDAAGKAQIVERHPALDAAHRGNDRRIRGAACNAAAMSACLGRISSSS